VARIIILERVNAPSDLAYRYVLWADVPAARQRFYADPNAQSAYLDATADDLAALRSGAVVEKVSTYTWQVGATLAQITAQLRAELDAFQDQITNLNLWDRYGTVWDGNSWTQKGVA
jgi:hypothetical protein